jgi:hypothetical protein
MIVISLVLSSPFLPVRDPWSLRPACQLVVAEGGIGLRSSSVMFEESMKCECEESLAAIALYPVLARNHEVHRFLAAMSLSVTREKPAGTLIAG